MKRLLLLIVALVMCGMSFAALTGPKYIPGDYATIALAITDLNTQGVGTGGVTFNVAAGYTETLTAPLSITATGISGDLIIFQKDPATTGANPLITAYVGTATPSSAIQDGMWNLVGSDYVTIDGIDLYDPNSTNPATMEYGFAMFKASVTNGAQYNTIQNCVVTLSRVNNASGSGPSTEGSKAINVVNALATTQTTSLTPTSAAGTNSYNKFYSNTLQNCNYGIVLYGYSAVSPFTLGDTGNDVGGSSLATGNTIRNYGGAAAASNPSAGVRANFEWGVNISYNNIDNNNGSGVNHPSTLRGIYAQAGVSANATINYNTISLKGGGTTSQVSCIENAIGSTAASNTIDISYNTIQNCTYTTATTATWYGIYNSSSAATVNITNNTLTNNAIAGTGTMSLISGSSPTNLNVTNNAINTISRTGSGTIYGIQITSPTNATVSGNTIYGLSQNAVAATGGIYGFYSLSSAVNVTVNNNIFHDFTSTGASTLYGIREYGVTGTKIFSGNQVYNLTSVGGSLYGVYPSVGTVTISKNQVYNLNTTTGAGGLVYGIYVSAGTAINVFNNFVSDLKAPAATGLVAVNGIYLAGGTTVNAYYNTVFLNASSTGTTFGSSGIYKSASSTGELRNNLIVNNSTPGATGGLTVAFRLSAAYNATYYTATSNNNNFYAGAPSANRVIFYDGTNTKITMGDYKAFVTGRDASSFSEFSPFVNSSTAPYDLHLALGIPTQCESGGTPVATPAITDDIDGNVRNVTTPDVGGHEGPFTPLPACIAPVSQPTALVLTPATTTVTGSFTVAAGSDSYLVLRSTVDPPTAVLVDGTTYAPGTILGNDTVVGVYPTGSFTSTGLHGNTTYYFYVYSMNSVCGGGPLYLAASPLSGSVTTAPVDPATFTAVASSASQINLTATANAAGSDIIVAWNTTNTFGTPSGTLIVGSSISGGGTVLYMGAAGSLTPHTGLTAGTTYYYKVWSYAGTAYSAPGLAANAGTYFGVPYPQDFNAALVYPTGWAGDMFVSATHGASASNGLYKNLYSSALTCNSTAPVVTLSALPCELKFDYRIVNYTGYPSTGTTLGASDKIDIQVSTDAGLTYTTVYSINSTTHVTSASFATKTIDLSAYSSMNVKVKFLGTWGAGDYYVDIDNFSLAEVPLCTPPSALAATNVTTTTADLGWTSGGTAWEYAYGVAPFATPTGAGTATTVNPVNITGLTPFTNYQFYVRNNCLGVFSTWVGPQSFYTGYCTPAPTSVDGSGITNVTFSTVNNTTVAEPGNYGNYSAMIGDVAQTATIPVAITYATGYTYDTKIWIDYNDNLSFLDAGEEVYVGTSLSTNPTTLAASFVVPGTAPLGNHRMRIGGVDVGPPTPCYASSYGTFEDYTVNVTVPPPCPTPSALNATSIGATTANLTWTPGGSETGWEYVYGVSPVPAPSGAGTATASSTVNPLTGLTASTTYQYYVRANCSPLFSTWVGPYTFSTTCDVVTAFNENFDGVTTPAFPLCWEKVGTSGSAYTQTTSPNSSPNCVYIYGYGGASAVLAMPLVSNAGAGTHQLRFSLRANYTAGESIEVGYMTDRADAATFVSVTSVVASSLTYVQYTVNLGTAPGAATTLAFRHPGTLGYSCLIDDVIWEPLPPCLTPTGLSATPATTSANLQWDAGSAISWDIEWGLAPYTFTGTPQITATIDNPYLLTPLTPATQYSYKVRANCTGGFISDWSTEFTFTTKCLTSSVPYTENFDAVTAPAVPPCITVSDNNVDLKKWVTATGYPRSTPNSMYISYNSAAAMNDWFFTPELYLPVGTYKVSFWYRNSGTSYPEKLEVKWGTKADAAFMTNGPIFDNNAIATATYVEGTGDLVVATAGNYYVGFHGYSDADMFYLVVDDISITEALAHDAGTLSLSLPGIVEPTTPIIPTAVVKNFGTNVETFDVTMTITDGYTSTQTVTALASGATQTVTFDSWTPALGSWTAQVCTALTGDLNPSNDCISSPVSVQTPVKIYAYNAYDPTSSVPEGPCYFYNIAPGTITSLAATTSSMFLCAGSWVNGVWYGSEYFDNDPTSTTYLLGGGWWTIDPTTGVMTNLAALGRSFTGIAYDHTNNILYGVDYDDVAGTNNLYTIVPATGVATLVGSLLSGELLIDLGYTGDGFLYGIGIGTDHLFKINPVGPTAVDLGACGYNFNYAQGMGYDYTTSTLFVAGYTTTGQLMSANLTTGACSVIGTFQGGAEIDGVAIPYSTNKTLNLSYVFPEGLYAGAGASNPSYDDMGLHFPAGVSDHLSVELHNATTYATIEYTASDVVLTETGTVTVNTPGDKNGLYYVTIKHRNSIETTSADPVSFAGSTITYAFDTQAKAYGSNMGLMIDGYAVIFAGDENQDGIVDGTDLSDIGNLADFATAGYLPQDINGDGLIDGSDLSIAGNNADMAIGLMTP